MNDDYFKDLIADVVLDDIDNVFLREVARKHSVKLASELILIYESVYPEAKEGQRKVNFPLKSTFTFGANRRRLDGVARA